MNLRQSLQLVEKARPRPVIYAKLSKTKENPRIFLGFDACGRVIVARGGNPDGSPSHSPSLCYPFLTAPFSFWKGCVFQLSFPCRTPIRAIHQFLNATGGNWRNAAYIECRCCRYAKSSVCAERPDWLYVPAADGTPLLLPVSDAETLFSCRIDKSECLLEISNVRFQALFRGYIMQHSPENLSCPLLIFCK